MTTAKEIAAKLRLLADKIDLLDEEPEEDLRQCLQCGEPYKISRRGLCERCYRKTYAMIRAGKLTEDEAVENGLFEQVKPGGPKAPRTKLDEYLAGKEIAQTVADEAENLEKKKRSPKKTKNGS